MKNLVSKKELDKETEELLKRGAFKTRPWFKSSKIAHKQAQPKTSKKWSLRPIDFIALKFSYFWKLVEKEALTSKAPNKILLKDINKTNLVNLMCSSCHKPFNKEELESWGSFYFCKTCIERVKLAYSKVKPRLELLFPSKTEFGSRNASYAPEGIRLINIGEDIKYILECISHESLHYVIHKIIDIKTSYNFDNFAHQRLYYNTPIATGTFIEEEEI